MSYNLHVLYDMKTGVRETFLNEVIRLGILNKIRAEEGCESYEFYYNAQRPDELLLLERWASKDAQKQHLAQPHMEEFFRLKDVYVEHTTLQGFEFIDFEEKINEK